MIEPWVWITVAAALFQTLRFALQKGLKTAGLSATGATWARFLWSVPFLWMGLLAFLHATGTPFPSLNPEFWVWAVAGGLGQILATVCVVLLFSLRHFAVGITLKKSETLLTVGMGWLLLGEGVSLAAFGAVALGVVGLLLLSDTPDKGGGWQTNALALGLLSGLFFALAGVAYRGATLSLEGSAAFRAGVALALVTLIQTLGLLLWLLWRDREEIGRVVGAWRPGLAVGLTSLAGSFCWFTAFAQANAAYVYAVGQVELLFSIIGGALFFGERITGREGLGIAVLCLSIVALVLVT